MHNTAASWIKRSIELDGHLCHGAVNKPMYVLLELVTKILISDVGMEKEQKQELGWRVSVLPIPAFHHCKPLCVACTQCTVDG